MDMLITGTLTTGEWIVAVASTAFLLLSLVAVVWACWLFVTMSDGAVARAIEDAERLADLKARVRGDFSRPISGRY
jgi:ABC-type branched-subunit amino acid transport system permease subunit